MDQKTIKDGDDTTNGGLGILHRKEIALLIEIRNNYRYGQVEILVQDGLPQQLIKTVVRKKLE